MVNGSRFYRALESVSIASTLSTALTIFGTRARSESINGDSLELQLFTARKKEWWPAAVNSLPGRLRINLKHTSLAGIEPTTFRLLVRRDTSCATETNRGSLKRKRIRCNITALECCTSTEHRLQELSPV